MKYSVLEGGEGFHDVVRSALDFESFLDEVLGGNIQSREDLVGFSWLKGKCRKMSVLPSQSRSMCLVVEKVVRW